MTAILDRLIGTDDEPERTPLTTPRPFVPAILAKIYFLRLILSGRLTKRGILDLEEAQAAATMKQEVLLDAQVEEAKAQQTGEGV